jgi:hypothetical protein
LEETPLDETPLTDALPAVLLTADPSLSSARGARWSANARRPTGLPRSRLRNLLGRRMRDQSEHRSSG